MSMPRNLAPRFRAFVLAAVSGLALARPTGDANACAIGTQLVFISTNHPDLPLVRFPWGHLGVIDRGWGRSSRVTAYRVLSGGGLEPSERPAALGVGAARMYLPLG